MSWRSICTFWCIVAVFPVWSYQQPDPVLLQLLASPTKQSWQTSSSGAWLLQLDAVERPTLQQLQSPRVGLAGLNINVPQLSADGASRYQRIVIKPLTANSSEITVDALPGEQLLKPMFSPDERWLSVLIAGDDGVFLELIELKKAKRQRLKTRLNAVLGLQYQWLADSSAIVAVLAPLQAVTTVAKPAVLPHIQQSDGQAAPQRTLQLLLQSTTDEQQFEQLIQGRLVRISTGLRLTPLLTGPIADFSLSPDNRYILAEQIRRPYSYRVRHSAFPKEISVFTIKGVAVTDVAALPLHEKRGERPGRRLVAWRPDLPATLYWVDDSLLEKHQDALVQWAAPFKQPADILYDSRWRVRRVLWSDSQAAIVYERKGQQEQAWLWADGFTGNAKRWFKRHIKDLQADPGIPVMQRTAAGYTLMQLADAQHIYVRQRQAVSASDHLIKVNLHTREAETIWQSRPDKLEQLIRFLPDQTVLFSQETAQQPAALYLKQQATETKITQRTFPAPAYQHIQQQIVHYQRADGVQLTGRLLLPAGYQAKMGPLPVLMWAYPREFDSAELAEQQQVPAQQFVSLSVTSAQPYVALGYAVFDQVSMPIIAMDGKQPNDDFLPQLAANAEATVKVLTDMGVAEADNIAIGGHSYGAFMVANLLAHTRLFKAGIARSGAYNRTLTPFGFQSEKRSLWQQPALYQEISPFLHADKIAAPLLLIHGEADSNSGTFPLQSIRLFEALQGLGKQGRLVLLPYEGHHYRATESLSHLLWEQQRWLQTHLRETAAMQQLTQAVKPAA